MRAVSPPEDVQPKANLMLNGELFAVDMQPFASRSIPFLRFISQGESDFPVKSPVARQSLETFIRAVHRQDYTQTRESAQDFADLCDEFEIADLKSAVQDFMAHQPNFVIDIVVQALRRGRATAEYESALRSQLTDLPVDRPSELPVEVMARLVDFGSGYDDDTFAKVFDLSMSYLERHPVAGSVLFQRLDVMRLDGLRRDRLFSSRDLDWTFINPSLRLSVTALIRENGRQSALIGELLSRDSGQREELSSLRQMTADLKSLADRQNSEIGKLTVGFERQQGQVSELQQAIADLRTEVATLRQSHEAQFQQSKQAIPHLGEEIAVLKEAQRAATEQFAGIQRRHEDAIAGLKDLLAVSQMSFTVHYEPGGHLKGIVAYLTSNCGGNVHDRGVVDITSSSVYNTGREAKCAADLEAGSSFASAKSANSWLKYDFKELRIRPTHYTLLSYPHHEYPDHPKHWKLEGSNDDRAWDVLDMREGNNDLNGASKHGTYPINTPNRYRYFHIMNLGPNHANRQFLVLSGFEIFGAIILDPPKAPSS